MRIRQVALVARELQPAVANLCAVLGIETAFNDPGVKRYGLENAVMPLGETFLEVVAPVQPSTTAGRYLDRRRGDGGYMVILQVDDIDAARRRVDELGIRIVERIDLPGAWATHLHPKDVPGAILSLDAMDPPSEWRWAGPRWREHVRTEVVTGIVAAEVQALDPAALARRWAEVLGRPVEARSDGGHRLWLDEGSIDFVPDDDGRGDGLGGITVSAPDPAAVITRANSGGVPVIDGTTVLLCGTRVRVLGPDARSVR